MNVRLSLRHNAEWDEWVVRWIENGRYCESKSYFTDDKDDAIATMRCMQRRIDDGGVEQFLRDTTL